MMTTPSDITTLQSLYIDTQKKSTLFYDITEKCRDILEFSHIAAADEFAEDSLTRLSQLKNLSVDDLLAMQARCDEWCLQIFPGV